QSSDNLHPNRELPQCSPVFPRVPPCPLWLGFPSLMDEYCNIFPLMTIMTIVTISRRDPIMSSQSWTVAEAKAKFSEIIERAMSDGPQTITRNGRKAAVLVGEEEWQRKPNSVG